MAAIKHEEKDTIIKHLEEYIDEDRQYLVSMETSDDSHKETEGQHFHFAVCMDEKTYDKFRKTILVNKYKLRGQAKCGLPRQYGRIRNVRDETKFLTYMTKEKNNNLIFKNIDLEKIQQYIEDSYKKEKKTEYVDTLMQYLEGNKYLFHNSPGLNYLGGMPIPEIDTLKLEELVLKHYLDNQDKVLTIHKLRFYVNHYLQKYEKNQISIILQYMKNKNI
jgi:hypothetical protein